MRLILIVPGIVLLIIGIYYLLLDFLPIFTIFMATITVLIGLKLAPPRKLTTDAQVKSSTPIVVDRGVLGASIYQLFFFDTQLVLKRLAGARTTLLSIVALALVGLIVDNLVGAFTGLASGYAIQEYSLQRNRVMSVTSKETLKFGPSDIEVPYSEIEKIQIVNNKLVLFSKRGITKLSLSRGYGIQLTPSLKTLFQARFVGDDSIHTPDTSRKKDH